MTKNHGVKKMTIYRLWAERIEDGDGIWVPYSFDTLEDACEFAGKHTSGLVKGKYIIAVYRNTGRTVRRVGEVFRENRALRYRDLTTKRQDVYALGTSGIIKEFVRGNW